MAAGLRQSHRGQLADCCWGALCPRRRCWTEKAETATRSLRWLESPERSLSHDRTSTQISVSPLHAAVHREQRDAGPPVKRPRAANARRRPTRSRRGARHCGRGRRRCCADAASRCTERRPRRSTSFTPVGLGSGHSQPGSGHPDGLVHLDLGSGRHRCVGAGTCRLLRLAGPRSRPPNHDPASAQR